MFAGCGTTSSEADDGGEVPGPPAPPNPPPPNGGGDGGNFGGPDIPLTQGVTVAQIATPQPSIDDFVLRATVPLPPGVYPSGANTSPFAVLNPDGSPVPAQTEIVSRYPNEASGADVVEIVALVERDPAIPTGQQAVYDVVLAEHFNPAPPATASVSQLAAGNEFLPPSVVSFLGSPNKLLIVAEDVFGNRYELDPLHGAENAEWMKYGHTMGQLKTWAMMLPKTPKTGATATLPHLFGVHAYATAWAGEELIGLDLRFTNGADGHNKTDSSDDPLGKVYFKYIHLIVPNGWFVQQHVEDPFFRNAIVVENATIFPLVDALGTGDMHVMGKTGQMHRRLMLSPLGNQDRSRAYLNQEGQGFCKAGLAPSGAYEYWSWWNGNTARYFPQSHILPTLDHIGPGLAQEVENGFHFLHNLLDTGAAYGAYPVPDTNLGWAHPFGVPYGGMTGGDEIETYSGVRTVAAASVLGYREHMMRHRMHTDRMPNAYYQRNGKSSSLEEWLKPGTGGFGDYIDMTFILELFNGDPMGFNTANPFQINAVAAQGRIPAYESQLLLYQIHDIAHSIRYTRNAKALAWLGNDSLAKDDLLHQAEMVHLTYNQYYNNPYNKESEAGAKFDRSYIDARPGTGYLTGRAEGWGIDTMNSAYAIASPAWRASKLGWYDYVADLIVDGQASCSGFLQANVSPKFLDAKYRARQSIEAAIMENAIRGMIETAYRGKSEPHVAMLEDALIDSFYAMVSPESWTPGTGGPWTYVAVAPLDLDAPPFCGTIPADGQSTSIDSYQTPSSLAYAYELTGDTLFLQKAEAMVGAPLQAAMEGAGTNNIYNRAALLALAQNL